MKPAGRCWIREEWPAYTDFRYSGVIAGIPQRRSENTLMIKRICITSAIFLLILHGALLVARTSAAQQNQDAQYWNTTNVEGEIIKNLSVVIDEEFRFGYDASQLTYQHTEAGLKYKFTGWFNAMPAYRQIFYKSGGAWLREYMPNLGATFSAKFRGFGISDRNRFELRLFSNIGRKWSYRNKLDIRYPIEVKKFELSPFISNEIFILMDDGKFVQNRFYAGFGVRPMEKIRMDFYCLWQTSDIGAPGWYNYNVFGTLLKFIF